MKLDIRTQIKDHRGELIKNGNEILTIAEVCCQAMLTQQQSETIDAAEKVRRFKMAMKFANGKDEIDLSAEEIASLKKQIGANFTPLVVGRSYEILDPEDKPSKEQV